MYMVVILCWDVGTGESVPTFSWRRVIVVKGDSCCLRAAGMKSGTVSRAPYTSSAEEIVRSSFRGVRIPSKTHSNSSIELILLALHWAGLYMPVKSVSPDCLPVVWCSSMPRSWAIVDHSRGKLCTSVWRDVCLSLYALRIQPSHFHSPMLGLLWIEPSYLHLYIFFILIVHSV